MINNREKYWDKSQNEDFESTEQAILSILREQKVSLSKIRFLFNNILIKIEDDNPLTLK